MPLHHPSHRQSSCTDRAHPAGRKKAVICGINYINSRVELEGCINDAKSIKHLLLTRFKFPESSIHMLTEEEKDQNMIPTKRNIRMAMGWLVTGVRAGDSLVFYFAGHGVQEEEEEEDEEDLDEVDGHNECISPLDYKTKGEITDDEINDTLVNPIPRGAKLTAIIDSCHSGTVLDLPSLCRMGRGGKYVWEDHRPKSSGRWKGTSGGEAICFSGCDDHQETKERTRRETTTGKMTDSFIDAVQKGHASTYGSLLNAMSDALRSKKPTNPRKIINTSLLQEPQLSANEKFNIYSKPFSL